MQAQIRRTPPSPRLTRSLRWFGCLLIAGAPLGCSSGQPADTAATPQTPAESGSHTYRIPPFFVDDRPSLRHDVPVKNDTGGPVRFTPHPANLLLYGVDEPGCDGAWPGAGDDPPL
jgi:hypothetical protein